MLDAEPNVVVLREGDLTTLRLDGELDLDQSELLVEAVATIWAHGTRHLVVDLRRCTFLDASCAEVLAQTCGSRPDQATCTVRGANGVVRRVLALVDCAELESTDLAPVIPLRRRGAAVGRRGGSPPS
jgi:anti-anti-sigma factor